MLTPDAGRAGELAAIAGARDHVGQLVRIYLLEPRPGDRRTAEEGAVQASSSTESEGSELNKPE